MTDAIADPIDPVVPDVKPPDVAEVKGALDRAIDDVEQSRLVLREAEDAHTRALSQRATAEASLYVQITDELALTVDTSNPARPVQVKHKGFLVSYLGTDQLAALRDACDRLLAVLT